MALGSHKSDVCAIVVESTEGTPVDPSAAGEYLTLQPGADMNPAFDTLENAEIRASIGRAKAIQGLERGEMTIPHYLKHSGTEGTAPEIDQLLKGAFGSQTTNSTERLTTSSSTTTLIKMASGGSDVGRGFAFLIKDTTNGYSVRNIMSMSTNDATLAFAVAVAPATGMGLGKCINFSPANSGHQSLTAWKYLGNGHGIEALAGGKVTSFSFTANAGELLNATFGLTGMKYYFNPIRVSSSDIKLDFYDGTTDFAATITAKLYRTPHELASALQSAMRTVSGSTAYSCTYNDSTGQFTFTKTSGTFSLKWATGGNTANTVGDVIGFVTASDDTGALTYTSDNAQTYAAPHTPSYDSSDPLAAKYQEVLIGDSTDTTAFEAESIEFAMDNERSEVKSICAQSGVSSVLISARSVKATVKGQLPKYDADKIDRMVNNSDTRFCYNAGTKDGNGNWVAGSVVNTFIPTGVVTNFKVVNLDGDTIGIEFDIEAYVDSSGNGEVYLNFL